VLNQLRRDPRTIALMLLVPVVLVFLLEQLFADTGSSSSESAGRCSASSR